MHLSKERRYLLNSTMIHEIGRRERDHHKIIRAEKAETGVSGAAVLHIPTGKVTTMTFYSIGTNQFYHINSLTFPPLPAFKTRDKCRHRLIGRPRLKLRVCAFV